jgi:epoxyqueuosine reductase
MIERLKAWAAERDYRVAWGPETVVESARREILKRRSDSEIDARFYEHELESMIAREGESAGGSVVIIAKSRPAHVVRFDVGDRLFDAVLPPTYFRYRATFEDVRMDLAANGLPGAQVDYLMAPLKATASRLGLVRYGRNNVSYVDDLGSYIQLCGYRVDAHLPEIKENGATAAELLAQCENCGICAAVCPTDAIGEDRMLLHAERCLTFLNENPGDWPVWVDPQAHNCLLGCLECQSACPANPVLPIEDTGLIFSAAETRFLLSDKSTVDDRAETGIRMKLAWLGQPYVESVLGRNLLALKLSKFPEFR